MSNGDRVQGYVTAFYEAAFERLLSGLDGVASALAARGDLVERLQESDVEFEKRQETLNAVLAADVDPLVRNFVYTLVQRGDISLLDEIATGLRARARSAAAAPVPVEVTTAVALADEQRAALEAKLAAQHGPNLSFDYQVDPAILGGVIVRVGDKLIDSSVAARLAAMKQALGVSVRE